jgi:hypothetical protein
MYVSHVPLGASAAQNASSLTIAIEQASDLGGGKVVLDAGTFPFDTVLLKSNVLIEGAGMDATVLVQADTLDASYGMLHAESPGTGSFVASITIRDLTLKNTVGEFEEFVHLLTLSGVRDVLIERVKFVGFQGDGLCIHGVGLSDSEERHNLNITVRDCIFDGVNHTNRQGITIIDCDGLVVDDCLFENCTILTKPGAINFEPDFDFNIIRNAAINGCVFRNVKGGIGAVALAIQGSFPVPTRISITNNFFVDYIGGGADITVQLNRNFGANDPDMAMLISGNFGSSGNIALLLFDVKGITCVNNVWSDYPGYGFWLGAAGTTSRDVVISDRFIRCGTQAGNPVCGAVENVDGLRLAGTEFVDCGDSSGGATALYFVGAPGASNNVDLSGAKVQSPGGRTVNAVLKVAGHTLTPANNRQRGFDAGGLPNTFVARAPDELLPMVTLTWDPPSLADGAGVTSSAITITGAAFGDTVTVGAPYDLQGITCTGYVSLADAVKIRLQNETGGTINLVSGDWKVTVTKALLAAPLYS